MLLFAPERERDNLQKTLTFLYWRAIGCTVLRENMEMKVCHIHFIFLTAHPSPHTARAAVSKSNPFTDEPPS